MAERLSAEQRNRIADRITKAYRASYGLADLILDASLADAEIDHLRAENTRLQAEVERLKAERQDMLTAKREDKPNG